MSKAGQKIIAGLKDAIAGNFARVTIDGQTWVRQTPKPEPADADKLAAFIEDWDRICLESGVGDWLDTHELPDHERALVISALRAFPAALGKAPTRETQSRDGT